MTPRRPAPSERNVKGLSATPETPTETTQGHPPHGHENPQQDRWRDVFIAEDGLRPAWCLALYGVMFFAVLAGLNWLAASLELGKLWSMMVGETTVFAAAAIPAAVMARIEKRQWASYGLPLRGAFARKFWAGAVWGFVGISALLVILHGLHAFDFGHIVLHGTRIAKLGVFWCFYFVVVGLFEELFFRGYSQFTLARGVGFWRAGVLLSLLFGAIHLGNPGEGWVGALGAAVIGLFFCLTLRRTGSLWFAVGFHAAWDWGESFFYSVPDSGQVMPGHLLSSSFHGRRWITGGTVGPEGSVVCFVVIAVMWVVFERVYPRVAETGN